MYVCVCVHVHKCGCICVCVLCIVYGHYRVSCILVLERQYVSLQYYNFFVVCFGNSMIFYGKNVIPVVVFQPVGSLVNTALKVEPLSLC